MTKTIQDHEGKKYLRTIRSCVDNTTIQVDVYSVLRAFNVTCPIVAHMVKKLLACGERGKGDRLADLLGVEAAVSRAIEEERKDKEEHENKYGYKGMKGTEDPKKHAEPVDRISLPRECIDPKEYD